MGVVVENAHLSSDVPLGPVGNLVGSISDLHSLRSRDLRSPSCQVRPFLERFGNRNDAVARYAISLAFARSNFRTSPITIQDAPEHGAKPTARLPLCLPLANLAPLQRVGARGGEQRQKNDYRDRLHDAAVQNERICQVRIHRLPTSKYYQKKC
jgi:hypothetical protein